MKKSKRVKKSNTWKIKQHRDQFFKKSKTLGYRSRAAFKLIELNNKFKFIKKNTNLFSPILNYIQITLQNFTVKSSLSRSIHSLPWIIITYLFYKYT